MTSSATHTDTPKPKKKRLGEFWRAARFIVPHRRYLLISLIAAILSTGIGTLSLPALFPVISVLLNDDNLPAYIDRQIISHRLGATLAPTSAALNGGVMLVKVEAGGPADRAGIKEGDVLRLSDESAKPPALVGEDMPSQFRVASFGGESRTVNAQLKPAPFYARAAYSVARHLPTDPLKALVLLLSGVIVLLAVANGFKFFQEHYADMAAIWAVQDVRRTLYDHLLHLPLTYYGRFGTSDVTSRLVSDANNLQEGFKLLLGQSLIAPLQAGWPLLFALYLDWRLTAFIIVFAPVVMAIIQKLGKKVRRATRTALAKNANMLGQLESSMAGIRVVKAARAERFERRRYSKIMSELLEQQRRMSRYEALTSPTVETLTMVVVGLIVIFAAYLVFRDKSLSRENFIIIMVSLGAMADPLRKMSKLNNLLQRSNAGAARIFEILDLPTERPRHLEGRAKLAPITSSITFDNLSFSYPGATSPAVKNVSLEIPRGRVVAIVGRNGSGKTTLLALLPRFYEPSAGRILIDGVDIATATLASLRGQISVVTQDSVIFPGTIAQNIAYGHPHAELLASAPQSDTARALRVGVEAAARKAFAHDFISAKPQGYDTPLDGLGGQLSGGQRQRLSIARALLRKAPILILDEATSQVDAESEHLIQQAIDSLMHEVHGDTSTTHAGVERGTPRATPDPASSGSTSAGPEMVSGGGDTTTFVIAHRFSTILGADEIIVMDAGEIVARGKHKTLLESSPVYRSLYDRQLLAPE